METKAINWYKKEVNEVYDFLYNELPEEQQYEYFKYLINHFPKLEIDWLEIFEDYKHDLLGKEKVDDILSFVKWYAEKFPDDYKQNYEFIERDLCSYFLFKKDTEKLLKRVALVKRNPVPGIDTVTVRLLYQLIYFGYYDMAVEYAKAVWKPVNESTELIGFAAYPFINTIYSDRLQQRYEALITGKSFDEDAFFKDIVKMGYNDDRKLFNQVMQALKSEPDRSVIEANIKKGKDEHMLTLNIQFLKYMLEKHKLPFILSEWLWNFIATTKIFGKRRKIDELFYVDVKTLDKHVTERFDNMYGTNGLEIFGKVWGLEYVFGFLNYQKLLPDDLHHEMRDNIAYIKNEMIKITGSDLWQMMFVFQWPQPHDFLIDPSEESLFKSTFGMDGTKAFDIARRYADTLPVSEKVLNELKSGDAAKEKRNMLWLDDMPYTKSEPKTGRNDPCPCGSGKKHKKCCLNNL